MQNKMIKFIKKSIFIMVVSFIAMGLGCVEKKVSPVVDTCPIPSGHLIDNAFETAKSTLSNPECRYKFETVFTALLNICEGAPDMKNKELFSGFFVWAKDQGIISKMQAKKYYTRYFSNRFVSLPGDYQTCSHCPRIKTVFAECWDEIENKEQGLLKICGDKATYAKAYDDLQKIELILEATCSACSAE